MKDVNALKTFLEKYPGLKGGSVVLGLIVLFFGIIYLFSSHDEPQPTKTTSSSDQKVQFDSPVENLDTQSYLVEHTQNQINAALLQNHVEASEIQSLKGSLKAKDDAMVTQKSRMDTLDLKLSRLEQQMMAASKKPRESDNEQVGQDLTTVSPDGLQDDAIQLAHKLTSKTSDAVIIPTKNPDTFVPSGTYVLASITGGADAPAGVTSQGNPTPMLFRFLDEGHLPNHGSSHLKGCVATAAAIGDVSSERGLIRLERLSCKRSDGSILDIPIEATVFGTDGKDGVRGAVVRRDKALVENAFTAGLFSGVSKGLQQSYSLTNLTPLGGVTQTVSGGHLLDYGAASGAESALEKIADYEIQQAEQYHPDIQVSAGQVVDIVFLKGFYLDGQDHENDADKIPYAAITPENSPLTTLIQTATPSQTDTPNSGSQTTPVTPPPLPLSPDEMARLKQLNSTQGGSP